MAKASTTEWIAWVIVVVGAINWGLVGFFNYNLVESLFGAASKWVYDLVGIAGVYAAYLLFTYCGKSKK
jgi:hypothetical protein